MFVCHHKPDRNLCTFKFHSILNTRIMVGASVVMPKHMVETIERINKSVSAAKPGPFSSQPLMQHERNRIAKEGQQKPSSGSFQLLLHQHEHKNCYEE